MNRKYFSTRDADNDGKPGTHCAVDWSAGFWYHTCGTLFLNGVYSNKAKIPFKQGIVWSDYRGDEESLKMVDILIRPV